MSTGGVDGGGAKLLKAGIGPWPRYVTAQKRGVVVEELAGWPILTVPMNELVNLDPAALSIYLTSHLTKAQVPPEV